MAEVSGKTIYPRIMPVVYRVTMLPKDLPEADMWSLTIEWCGFPKWNAPNHPRDRVWAVRRRSQCLSRTGRWVFEPQPSSRTPTFYKRHRFTEDEARQVACAEVGKIVINGMTWQDVLDHVQKVGR